MSDSDRCRATAARYALLADRTPDADVKSAYLELEGLWLETATWTDRLQLKQFDSARRRIYELFDASTMQLKEVHLRLN